MKFIKIKKDDLYYNRSSFNNNFLMANEQKTLGSGW